ncbi:MAG: hypothetical protein BWX71_00979 [Deltaproteobacteria bacterium ADurb.Bin072]|nr:MAG: hypothetical protein BWX71_00979 [Deltaproteobacteria bacterium ADurb.Bin072]
MTWRATSTDTPRLTKPASLGGVTWMNAASTGSRPESMREGILVNRHGMRSTRPPVMASLATQPEKKVLSLNLCDWRSLTVMRSPRLTIWSSSRSCRFGRSEERRWRTRVRGSEEPVARKIFMPGSIFSSTTSGETNRSFNSIAFMSSVSCNAPTILQMAKIEKAPHLRRDGAPCSLM